MLVALPAYGAVTITPSVYGTSSVMPGSSTDFTLFGNPTQFPSGSTGITKNSGDRRGDAADDPE